MNLNISSLRKKLRLGLMLIVVFAMPTSASIGQDKPEPSAIIAIAPIDDQLKDIEYLAGATSEAFGQMSGLVRLQAQGFLPGVDFTKPIGAMLYFETGKPEPKSVAFFPIKNLDDVLDKISEFAELEEEGETVTIIPDNGDELTLTSKDGYAFVSDVPEMLENLPENPADVVSELTKKYNFSAKLFAQNIPEDLRDIALDWMKDSYESTLDQMGDLQAEFQEAQFDMQMKQLETMVNDVDFITIGFDADKANERIYFDLLMKGVKDSEFQKRVLAGKSDAKSKFTGFLMDKAALTFHNCSGISEEDAKIYVDSMENMRDSLLENIDEKGDEVESEIAEKISGKLVDVMKKTFMAGTMDMGGAVFTDDGLNAAFGAKVVDASELESSIKDIVSEAESKIEDDEVVFNLNSGTHAGLNLHEILINLDEDEIDENVISALSSQVKVILAIGKDQLYVGVGKNPEPTLKKSIDANASDAKQGEFIGQYNVFIAPVMKLVTQIETEEEIVQMLSDKIEEVGKDRIRVTWDVVDGEIQGRMEIQDGIFQMFGVMAENMSGMGGGGADF